MSRHCALAQILSPPSKTLSLIVWGLIVSGYSVLGWSSALSFPSGQQRSRQTLRLSTNYRMGSLYSKAGSSSSEEDAVCNSKTMDRFGGKTVLLTGASGGLGRCLAKQLAHCGVKTLMLSGRSEVPLEQVAQQCQEIAPSLSTIVVPCDLNDKASVANLGNEAQKVGIDVLVNNGGLSSRSRFLDTKLQVDEMLMQVNFLSGVALAKTLVPGMIEKGSGTILWISSVQGLVGIPNRTSYAASKFAVQGYCEALRGELASSGVTVHVASPGYIRTNLSRSAITGDGTPHGKMDDTTANGAHPNDVAVTVLESVSNGKADFVVAAPASGKAAIWLRLLWPSLLNRMLVKRYNKSLLASAKDQKQD